MHYIQEPCRAYTPLETSMEEPWQALARVVFGKHIGKAMKVVAALFGVNCVQALTVFDVRVDPNCLP